MLQRVPAQKQQKYCRTGRSVALEIVKITVGIEDEEPWALQLLFQRYLMLCVCCGGNGVGAKKKNRGSYLSVVCFDFVLILIRGDFEFSKNAFTVGG